MVITLRAVKTWIIELALWTCLADPEKQLNQSGALTVREHSLRHRGHRRCRIAGTCPRHVRGRAVNDLDGCLRWIQLSLAIPGDRLDRRMRHAALRQNRKVAFHQRARAADLDHAIAAADPG